ncbi:hypothetical protein Psi01_85700 [Planobispora siamensis]|uniref:Uncharacterized protein n=1 Tax=Planobispora siamensis TaxID=936338 RepID=A0A8J3WQD1_9ACTN|nr:hypothetical protein Psi01_85700 [Planobispora siamensis]
MLKRHMPRSDPYLMRVSACKPESPGSTSADVIDSVVSSGSTGMRLDLDG